MWCCKPVILRCREPDACGSESVKELSLTFFFFFWLYHARTHTHALIRWLTLLKSAFKGMREAILSDCKRPVVRPFTWRGWTLTLVSHPLLCQPVEYESHGGVVKALGGLTTRGHGGSMNITDTKTQGPHRSAMRHVVYHRNFRFWVKSQALFTLVQ